MSALKILKYPVDEASLRVVSKAVQQITPELRLQMGDMHQALAESEVKGIGISAPQVGFDFRAFILDTRVYPNGFLEYFINPKLIRKRDNKLSQEGCLSFPGEIITVPRFMDIGVQYLDLQGIKRIRTLSGIHAVAFQHELDHLNGILLEDYRPREA